MTTTDAQAAFLNQGRALGFPAVVFDGRVVDGEVAYGLASRSATPFQLEQMADQLRELQSERAHRGGAEAEWTAREAQREAARNSTDPLARLDRERADEMRAAAQFRASDAGRLEELIRLGTRTVELLEALQRRG